MSEEHQSAEAKQKTENQQRPNQQRKITAKTKQRIVLLIIYVIIGFVVAYVWDQMKKNQ